MRLLVEPGAVAARLGDPDLRIIDASWYLTPADGDGAAEYAEAHLPGAIHLDVSTELADADSPLRNAAPAPDELARRFARAGVGRAHDVVVYDRRGGYSAGRVWWLLGLAGHERTALLAGGFARWAREGRPTTREVPAWPAARFEARPRADWIAHKRDVVQNLETGRAQVVDARSRARFDGDGHIPGSVNVPWSANLDERDDLLEPAALRALYERAGVDFSAPVITTCGSGITASLDAFALRLAGHPHVAVYDGSWDEWSKS